MYKKSERTLFSKEDAPKIDYYTKDKALKIIYDGYTILPKLYQEIFLNPLRNLITTEDYATILRTLDQPDGPYSDWLALIHQRTVGYKKEASYAFEECVADLYDGFLSMAERRGIKPPDYQPASPLIKWGRPDMGPYALPEVVGTSLGMSISVVSMPSAYSENIALWSPIGHETGGHAILHANRGILDELGKVVVAKILKHRDDPVLKKEQAILNGRKIPVAKFAALYWKITLDETASDVCGLLNLGPAAGIGLAIQLIPFSKGKLITAGPTSDIHPIDALRILLAADVIRDIPDLDVNIANAWGDTIEHIVDRYITDKNGFGLYTKTQGGIHWDAQIPYDGMRETVRIIAKTIAFTPLDSLGGHCLSEINTWANSDEDITLRIVDDFLNKKQPSLELGPDGQIVYAAHILSGAIIASIYSTDIPTITKLAIASLNKLRDNNPVWRGFPVHFRSDTHIHKLVSSYGRIGPEKIY